MELLTTRQVTVRYPGAKPLILPNLTVASGSLVPLNGRSGAGKTTLAKHVLGLLPDGCETSGVVEIHGRAGWIPQDVADAFSPFQRMATQLCDGAEHHLGLKLEEAVRVAGAMLEQLGVDPERMHDHPHRWSGGMLQRGLVVMALIAQPKIVIADEPTASLDEASAKKVYAMLEDYAARGNGVVIISHERYGALAG